MPEENEIIASTARQSAITAAVDVGMRTLRRLVLALLVLTVVGSCLLTVEQHEIAFVLRWGRIVGEGPEQARGPGFHLVRPYPIDEVVRVPVQRVQSLSSYTFWPSPPPDGEGGYGSYTMTSDANILHSGWALRYVVRDPARHVFGFADARQILQNELDRAVLRACAMFSVDEILRASRAFSDEVTRILRERCEQLALGVYVEQVDLMRLNPPLPVRDAFAAVLRAEQERGALAHAARLYYNREISEARAAAAAITAAAEGRRARMVAEVANDADYFKQLLPAYLRQPALVKRILLQERLRTVLDNADAVYLIGERSGIERELRLQIGAPKTVPRTTTE